MSEEAVDTSTPPTLVQKIAAEALGTAVLVFLGCGSVVIFSNASSDTTGLAGLFAITSIGLTFGIAIVAMAYTFGRVSGGHFNPAVSLGLTTAGRFPRRNLPWYVFAQVVGAFVGASFIQLLTLGMPEMADALSHVANGYGDHSPGGFGLIAPLLAESVLTFFFVLVVLGATDGRAPAGFAPLAIGLTLVAILLIGLPITNLSVNPARSTGPAILAGPWALAQLWVFWLAPLWGGFLAGKIYRIVGRPR